MKAFSRHLIVNADDFGLSQGVNDGIIRAHEQGIVTSASLMVRAQNAREAAHWARSHPEFGLGLHLDLCEWCCEDDVWRPVYEVVPLDDPNAVEAELAHQLNEFRRLVGRLPTHLDSHQHVHRNEPIRSIVQRYATQMGVVLRSIDSRVHYCGEFYGQSDKGYSYPEGISVQGLSKVLRQLPEGFTELGCHPSASEDVESVYRAERLVECQTLCDPRIREVLTFENIHLCSFLEPELQRRKLDPVNSD